MSVNVYTFDPVIYPRKVWIAVTSENEIEGFSGLSQMDDSYYACVDNAHDDKNNFGGVFIRFYSLDSINASNIAHESTHVAMNIIDYIGGKVDLNNQEYLSYLVGWVAKCCEEVKQIETEKLNK